MEQYGACCVVECSSPQVLLSRACNAHRYQRPAPCQPLAVMAHACALQQPVLSIGIGVGLCLTLHEADIGQILVAVAL